MADDCKNQATEKPDNAKIAPSPLGSVVSAGYSLRGKVRKLCSLFESPKIRVSRPDSPEPDPPFRIPGTEDRVVIYFTSLRSIRKTFQECHSTRMIFRGLGVNVDERDISMDAAYRKELQRVLGENNIGLPQVFIKGKYVGGAEVVRQLVEMGELGRLIKGLPLRRVDPCEGCGDVRFVPCTSCNGSRKVFEHEEDGPTRCLHCNENGLVRCPRCCFS
ncbi:Glutaredoxin family protein [Striga hermonthica]|uniref:Glutaredoxin family protein n=1 Tax=Striga hermonthica TaxID=68872 RepID=A0A9N7MKI7_STRHE|nr:Glutaredoxin family protein [Striga hermonthica]